MTARGRFVRGSRWVGPGLVVVGATGLLAVLADSDRSAFEFGVLYTASRYDQTLQLLGVSFAVAQGSPRVCALGIGLFTLGLLSGGAISDWIALTIRSHPGLTGYVFLIGPAYCVAVGISLAAPRRMLAWLAPPAAYLTGAALGLVLSFNDPTVVELSFGGGAILAGLWLVVPPLIVWRTFAQPWFAIAGRIFGSWLIAIGAMLGAAQVIPQPLPPEPPGAVGSPTHSGAPLANEPPVAPPPADPPGLPDIVQ